jgi:hypothetical protein
MQWLPAAITASVQDLFSIMELQRLSLSDYRHGTKEQKSQFASQLLVGFATCGFVKLDNHEFDGETVRQLFEWVSSSLSPSLEQNGTKKS